MCEGEVTVNDPGHPLFGRALKLAGFACLPGHVRHCQVEIFPDQYAYIPVPAPICRKSHAPNPPLLTATAIAELASAFSKL